ncbi:threonine/homoserine/homoserine lactone efflux protein [Herbihabitans rhizosphaerae]|uniref:Threonine/homoserine/homoserine lactone efflux protein n=1 Tax=Herbihabitans rhizosphaerae TaxID=1872711 RepID=A0A4Q7L462_9PSEU|nr:LysE family translocator [Herbihabitans rhizosphaerae]RZS43271.1 threonine/homoserine/homoserine lactone efflux protein [Herbihabitans rhizosphaerae]
MDVSPLLAFAAAAVLIAVVPGPDMIFIIAHGVAKGRRAGVLAALGMSTGLAVHTLAAALGLGALLAAAPAILDVLRVLGAIFLVYLAVTTLRSSRKAITEDAPKVPPGSLRRTYVMAVLTNLANPKVVLFYVSFVPQFLTTSTGAWPVGLQFIVLGALLIAIGLIVDATAGLLAGTLSEALRRKPAVQRWLDRVSAAIFGALAARLVTETATR